MPIGTDDVRSSLHCRHSTTQWPLGRCKTLGLCDVRTGRLLHVRQLRQGARYRGVADDTRVERRDPAPLVVQPLCEVGRFCILRGANWGRSDVEHDS